MLSEYLLFPRNSATLINMDKICVVDECEKPLFRCDWCSMHYSRLLRYGDLEAVHKPGKPRSLGECSILGCHCPAIARDFCTKHYTRWSKFGDPLFVKLDRELTTEERFWVKVSQNGPVDPELGQCWIWTAGLVGGFGAFSIRNHQYKAHIVSYAWANGYLPMEKVALSGKIGHLCSTKSCVRPNHLTSMPGFIYVIRCGSFSKIGFSKDPERRLRDLQCANPLPLELIGTIPGSLITESRLHAEYRNKHVRNEWFDLTEEDIFRIIGKELYDWSHSQGCIDPVRSVCESSEHAADVEAW